MREHMAGTISLTGGREPDPLKICEGDKLGSLPILIMQKETGQEAACMVLPISATVPIPGNHSLAAAPRA